MKKLIFTIQLILSLNAVVFAQDILTNGLDAWPQKIISNPNLQIESDNYSQSFLDTIYSFPTPGTFPLGLAWDGVCFWNSDVSTNLIYKLNKTGQIQKSFSLPPGSLGGDLTWDGSNLWCVDEENARLYKIDTTNGSVVASFNLPDSVSFDPNSWGLAWDGTYLWHSQYGSQHRIFKLNPKNGQVISSFDPISSSVLGIEWINGFIYGISLVHDSIWHSVIYKYDSSSGIILDSASWDVPYPLGLIWDGSHLWNVSSSADFGGANRIYQVASTITSIFEQTNAGVVTSFILSQNYPNPFNPVTNLEFGISDLGFVSLKVFDILGKEIITLVNEKLSPGNYKVEFDGRGLPSGVYFYRLTAVGFTETKRMMLIK